MYRNGVLATGASSTYGGTPPSGSLKPSGSLRINLSGLRLNGAVSSVLIWDRELFPDEVAEVSRDPWQLFARRVWVPQAAITGLPTLYLPTYTPGSLTGVGFRPRVTAT